MASPEMEEEKVAHDGLLSRELGQKLLAAREQKALSVGDVAEQLKIAKQHIEHFESDGFDLQTLDPFQRGYIRNYAELMNVDLAEYEHLFPEAIQIGSSLQSVDLEEQTAKPLLSIAAMRIITVLLIIAIVALLITLNV